jgi:cell wall-associated NlpC family hydrolase
MPRSVLLAVALCCALAAPAHAAVGSFSSWDLPQQRDVVHAGLLSRMADGHFDGAGPLTGHQLDPALAQLGVQLGVPAVLAPDGPMTVAAFDDTVRAVATGAGLQPPRIFGTEVVARYLGLRYDHPFPLGEAIELDPSDRITRAEAAWSLAVVMHFGDWQLQDARSTLGAFSLPAYDTHQLAALRIAVSKIGMPYVWGGETDGPSPGHVHGGYDCSGFVWRVFKLTGLVGSIEGRTAAQMAGEIPRSRRVRFAALRPGDLMFFGRATLRSKATESDIVHTAIVLGNGWLINSSGQGVAVEPMAGWYQHEFAWGRRVL